MSSDKESSRNHRRSRLALLDRLIPLVGLALALYLVRRINAERRANRGQFTDVEGAIAAALAARSAAATGAEPGLIRKGINRFGTTKKFLVLAMLLALIAYVSGGSTFASFSAEVGNPASQISSGTLTMSDQVNSGTVCNSYSANSQDNYADGSPCSAILAMTNEAPGTTDTSGTYIGGYAKVTIKNTGSLPASLFSLFAPYVNGQLSTQVNSGASVGTGQTVTSFSVSSLEGPVATNDKIILSFGSTTQEFCAGAGASASATTTSITISGGYSVAAGTSNACPGTSGAIAAGATFAVGTRLNDTSTDTTPSNTDCWDAKTTTSPVGGATKGTDLNFNPITGNPFCSTALFWIQEQSVVGANTYNYCWFGRGSTFGDQGGNTEDTNGQCRTPTQMALSSSITTPAATATSLNGAITNSQTSIIVNSAAGFPTTGNYTINVDNEQMIVTGGQGTTTWTVTRASSGTTAASHSNSAAVTLTSSATLNGAITNSQTSITLNENADFATGNNIVIDSEEMTLGSNTSGTTWNVTRGVNGTTAVSHLSNANVNLALNIGSTLNGNVTRDDQITLTESGSTLTCYAATNPVTTTAAYYIGTNTAGVVVKGCYGAPSSTFDSSAVVKDVTAFTNLNGSNPSSTLSNFDTAHLATGAIFMPPLTGNGTDNTAATVQLAAHGDANSKDIRIYYIGVYFPSPSGTNQNYLQGLISTFGVNFHIDQ